LDELPTILYIAQKFDEKSSKDCHSILKILTLCQ